MVVGKEVVRYETDFSPVYLVGRDPQTGETVHIDATTFGGDRKPIYDWVARHG